MSQVVSSGSSNISIKSNYQNRDYGSTINKRDVAVNGCNSITRENEVEEYDFSDNIVSDQLRKFEEGHKILEQQKLNKEIEEMANMSEEEIIDMVIDIIDQTGENLENDKKSIEEKFNSFQSSLKYDDLWINPETEKYLTPEEYLRDPFALESFLYNNNYPIDSNVDPDKYNLGYDEFKKYVDNEYSKIYSRHFKEVTGMSYEDYKAELAKLKGDIQLFKSSRYTLVQQAKACPYNMIFQSEEFKKYVLEKKNNKDVITVDGQAAAYGNLVLYCNGERVNENIYEHIKNPINPIALGEAIDSGKIQYQNYSYSTYNTDLRSIINDISYNYLTDKEKLMYSYLFDTKGKEEADKYIKAIEDAINQRKGREEANEFIASISDENGNIDYDNAINWFKTAGKGLDDGINNFFAGLDNVFETEGTISEGQYASMYILEELTNSSGIYIMEIAENIQEESGTEKANEFLEGIYNKETGKINLDYAKKNLTTEEYNKFTTKINIDNKSLLDNVYELSTSFGNMVPSMAASYLLAKLGASHKAAALVGNTLIGLSAGGNAKKQALISGNDLTISTIYGLLSGCSETTLGYLLGNIPGLNPSANFSIMGNFSEGLEECLQEYIDAGLRSALLGETINLDELSDDALKSFEYGVLMSCFMNGGKMNFRMIANSNVVEVHGIKDFYKYFNILNDPNINILKDTNTGKKVIVIDKNTINNSKKIDIIKKIFPDSDIYIKGKYGNISLFSNSDNNTKFNSNILKVESLIYSDIREIFIKKGIIISDRTAQIIAENIQGYTEVGRKLWVSNFNKLTNEQIQLFNEYINMITSLNYTYNVNHSHPYGTIKLDSGETVDTELYIIQKTNELVEKLGIEYPDSTIKGILTVAPSLTSKKSNVEINKMIQRLVANLFFINNGVSNNLSDIILLAELLFGSNLEEIDIINNPENKEKYLHKLNNFEVRVLYNYNETIILKTKNKETLNNWDKYDINKKLDLAKKAYNSRNILREISQEGMIVDYNLPKKGTNPLMTTFEGAIIYNIAKADPANFKELIINSDCPDNIKNIVLSVKDISTSKELCSKLKQISISDIDSLYNILKINTMGESLLEKGARQIIETSHRSNEFVNHTLGINNDIKN